MKRFRVAYYTSHNTRIDQVMLKTKKKVFACTVVTVHTIYVWAVDAGEALVATNGLDYVKALTGFDQIRVEAVK